MSDISKLDRRTLLRGVGTAMALPLLDAMLPSRAWAAADRSAKAPLRIAFLYVPNGAHMPDWTPAELGTAFTLPPILEPLQPVKDEICILSGLAHTKANANGDGGGDHARSVATFLTGMQAKKTHGKDIRIGVSVDQFAAQQIGSATKLPSLELGCEPGQQAGNCDSGYSCAYSSNMSWRTESTPMPKENNPRAVFDRLFSNAKTDEAAAAGHRRDVYRQSILDFVMEDARRLKKDLGQTDRRKIDEYLDSVRSLERRIDGAPSESEETAADVPLARPQGIPGEYGEHLRLMGDLLATAFQLDMTRIATFMLANAGSNRSYRQIDVPEGHHDLSHHGNDQNKQAKISKINRFHVEQLAYLLGRLQSMPEKEGTVLDNCLLVYGSGIGDGNRHNHDDLPILLCGGGGGTITPGRHVRYDSQTPLMNLYLSLLDRMQVDIDQLGDSTGRLDQLQV